MVKALIITGFGINCEEEMAAAFSMAGAQIEILHLNEILLKGKSIHEYDILNFPGGFSFGDDISSGKVMANKIKYKKLSSGKTLLDEIILFLEAGKFVFGICNGFQILVKLGLLPNISGKFEQEVSLRNNDSHKFEDRWVNCIAENENQSPFLTEINTITLPVRHGEGKLIIKNEAIKNAILDQNLNCLTYSDDSGTATSEYPFNPNGSNLNCAGLTNPSRQVFGLMPHPEAFLSLYNHPNWGKIKRENPATDEQGAGLKFFKNIVDHISKQKSRNES